MTTIQFLAEWALRSSILILSGALLLWALRVKDPSIRLAAWTAMLLRLAGDSGDHRGVAEGAVSGDAR